jgi:hypothetical protein
MAIVLVVCAWLMAAACSSPHSRTTPLGAAGEAGQGGAITAGGDAGQSPAGEAGHSGATEAGQSGATTAGGSLGESGTGPATAGAGGAAGSAFSLDLEGCQKVSGDRPMSVGGAAAPKVATIVVSVGDDRTLSGTLAFDDPSGDATELIVQVDGSADYYVCSLTQEEIASKTVNLSVLRLGQDFPEQSLPIYLAVRDAQGNVSGYAVGSLIVGDGLAPPLCTGGVARAIQLVGKVPEADTSFYAEKNGFSPDYSYNGSQLAVVSKTTVAIDLGTCSHLYLAANPSGTLPVGWDNCLMVELRHSHGAPVESRWYYCSYDRPVITYLPTGVVLTEARAATVSGSSLDPAVPNGSAFGHAAKAIDLSSQIPVGLKQFELTLTILDQGGVGSTTDVWALPE